MAFNKNIKRFGRVIRRSVLFAGVVTVGPGDHCSGFFHGLFDIIVEAVGTVSGRGEIHKDKGTIELHLFHQTTSHLEIFVNFARKPTIMSVKSSTPGMMRRALDKIEILFTRIATTH